MSKKISVIIPVYNSQEYLRAGVESVLNQTYDNVEIVLVNNGSNDSSLNICQELAVENDNIIVHSINDANVSIARNIGVDIASGEYICFFDSDDFMYPNALEILFKGLKKANANLAVANYKRKFAGNIDFITRNFKYNSKLLIETGTSATIYEMPEILIDIFTAPWAKLYKKSALFSSEKWPLFDGKFRRNEDIDFTIRQVATIGKITYIDKSVLDYFVYEKPNSIKKMLDTKSTIAIFEQVFEYYKENNVFEQFRDELEYLKIYHLLIGEVYRMVQVRTPLKEIDLLREQFNSKMIFNNKYVRRMSIIIRMYLFMLMKGLPIVKLGLLIVRIIIK